MRSVDRKSKRTVFLWLGSPLGSDVSALFPFNDAVKLTIETQMAM